MNRNNRRGFTLTELSVVLAVLAIVSTMVVSFTVMVSNSRALSSARLDALGDVRVAEANIEHFIEENDSVTVTADKKSLSANGKTLSFTLENGKTVGGTLEIKPIGENTTADTSLTLERVKSITFEYYGGDTDEIYYCTIHYEIGGKDYTYIFCVNPYVGESIKEGT